MILAGAAAESKDAAAAVDSETAQPAQLEDPALPQDLHEAQVQEPDLAETPVQVIICLTHTHVAFCSCPGTDCMGWRCMQSVKTPGGWPCLTSVLAPTMVCWQLAHIAA